MKEERYFYVPRAAETNQLPDDEAAHALRVLRLGVGDAIVLMDGEGTFYDAVIDAVTKKSCQYRIAAVRPQQRAWEGHIHLALAPTKNIDRTEWFIEKATEIGIDEISLLRCQFSERTTVKVERLERIITAAMKQSRKAWRPWLHDMRSLEDFLKATAGQQPQSDEVTDRVRLFICHCYEQPDLNERLHLKTVLRRGENSVVMIGPEGDFSIDEVRLAEQYGCQPVTLGSSRLRTETAALVASHMMYLENECLTTPIPSHQGEKGVE